MDHTDFFFFLILIRKIHANPCPISILADSWQLLGKSSSLTETI